MFAVGCTLTCEIWGNWLGTKANRAGNQFSYQHQGKVYAEACASDVLHTRLMMKQVCVWIWGCLREMGYDVSRSV